MTLQQRQGGSVKMDFDAIEDRADVSTFDVPRETIGFLLGKSGITLRGMENKYSVFMFLDNDRQREGKHGPCKRLYVVGNGNDREAALDEAEEIVRFKLTGQSSGRGGPPRGPPPGAAYRALGARVTLISSRDQVLPGEDADAAAVIEKVFTRNGMTVLSKSRADHIDRTEDGVMVTLSDGRTVEGSHCLIAVGAIPNTAGIGLEEAGVQLTESGHIRVNRVARTSMPSVYAAGDCSDFLPLASVASMQGRSAIFHAMGDAVSPTELRNVTSNIFTQPEVATVGWSQKQIEDGIAQGEIYKLDLPSNPRAKMMGIKDGFVKLFARTGSGTVIGGVIVGPKASDLILPIALAVEHRLTVDQLASAFSVYPSLSGSITDAARAMHIVD